MTTEGPGRIIRPGPLHAYLHARGEEYDYTREFTNATKPAHSVSEKQSTGPLLFFESRMSVRLSWSANSTQSALCVYELVRQLGAERDTSLISILFCSGVDG